MKFDDDDEHVVLEVPLPKWNLPVELTHAERGVALALLSGASVGEIAAQRGTSTRTVANQVQVIYQKARVNSVASLALRCARPVRGTE